MSKRGDQIFFFTILYLARSQFLSLYFPNVCVKGKYEKQEVLLRERGTSWGVPGCRCRGYPESSLPPQTDALPPSRARSHSPRSHHREEEEEEAIAPCTIRNSSASSGPHGASGGRRTDALTSMSQLSDVVCENTKLKQQVSILKLVPMCSSLFSPTLLRLESPSIW